MNRRRLVQSRVRMHAALERAFARDITRIFGRIARLAADAIVAGRDVDAIVDDARAALMRAYIARNQNAARVFIAITLEQVRGGQKADGPSDIAGQRTLDWIRRNAARFVQGVLDRTKSRIRKIVLAGDEEGVGTLEIARNIREAIGGSMGRRRAETIARTETHTAASYGSQQAAEESGVDLVKEWAAAEDSRTRPDHMDADGQVVAMDEPFIVGGEALDFPGDPMGSPEQTINCRCTVLYRPKE